ncbi:ABC-2 type transport system permease protein [Clostridium acidisoli DSM 12555]|uniref:ABC-2 type transport system permease protein n=1 Tax=Clostridium acidisoli DSM 12555 TaxID=1121291 RepID=A0A1W1XZB8_9CLOT|nr:ABC transporter permease [Clostridium acidisoli]SMC28848.1 ABC-2 type transport system permease protein [Clostridium acidisoli DSM 12555]
MQVFKLTILHLKRMISNKSVLLLTLLMPMFVMCLVTFFSGSGNNNDNTNVLYIDFVNKDNGQMGNNLIQEFKNSPNFNVYVANQADAKYRVEHNVVAEAIMIPHNFSESLKNGSEPNIQVLTLSSGNTNLIADNKINSFINENLISKQISASLKSKLPPSNNIVAELSKTVASNKIMATSQTVKKNKTNSLGNQISINLCISFMMFTVIFIVNEVIARKDDKTLKRSLSTPNSKFVLLFSIVLAFLIVGWLQVLLMIGSTTLLFKLSWGSSIPALLILFTSLILVVLGLGVLLCRLIKSRNNAPMICQMVIQISCLMGGSYMPLEFFPPVLKHVAYFMPQSWAVTALTDVVLNNKGLISILPNIGVLLLFAVAFFTAGASTIRGTLED